MARVFFTEEEYWPVIELDEWPSRYDAMEIPDDLLSRYRFARAEWGAIQDELHRITSPVVQRWWEEHRR